MSPNCPIISIIDDERYCINDMFEKRIKREESNVEIEVGGKIFSLLNTKVEDSSVGGSKIFLYANDRMVKSIDLDKTLVDLDKNIFDDKGYYYVGILTGKYLDDNVEMNRTSFDISESSSEGDISMDDIIAKAKEQVELYLNDYLEEVRDKKNERIRKYISANAPQFGHLLKYMPESINAIKPTLTDAKLDEELYKIKRKFFIFIAEPQPTLCKGSARWAQYKIKRKLFIFIQVSILDKLQLIESYIGLPHQRKRGQSLD